MLRSLRQDRNVLDEKLSRGLVRRILVYGRPYRGLIVAFLVVLALSSAVGIVPPLLMQRIIDDGVLAGDKQVVLVLAGAVAALAFVDAALNLIGRWCSATLGESLILDLRRQVYGHVQSMPLSFFTRAQTGKLVSRLNTDVIGAQQAFTSTLTNSVSNVLTVALTLGAMITLSPRLTLIALAIVPIFLIPARIMGSRLAGLTRRQMNLNGEVSEIMTERFSVSGAMLVKLFGRPEDELDHFDQRASGLRGVAVKIAMNVRFFMVTLTLLAALATAVVYGLGGVWVIDELLTIGTLTAMAGLLARLYAPLTALTSLRVDIMTALVSFDRVFELLDREPAIQDAPDARSASGVGVVEFDHVWFHYPDQLTLASLEAADDASSERVPADLEAVGSGTADPDRDATPAAPMDVHEVLRDISFRVEPGHTLALVGPSGAGKTTMTHLIARLYDVSAGAIRVGGDDVRELTQASLREQVGYVTQDAHMFHDTVRANLEYARPGVTEDEIWTALAAARVDTVVGELPNGLDTIIGERGYRLSGGERQRLAIARLMLKAPPVVVLDEATAHLDSESEAQVQQALEEAAEGRTSIVIAHRLSTVRRADEILVLEQGQVVERGRHEDLLAAGGLYADLYHTQFAD